MRRRHKAPAAEVTPDVGRETVTRDGADPALTSWMPTISG